MRVCAVKYIDNGYRCELKNGHIVKVVEYIKLFNNNVR